MISNLCFYDFVLQNREANGFGVQIDYSNPMDPSTFLGSVWGMIWRVSRTFSDSVWIHREIKLGTICKIHGDLVCFFCLPGDVVSRSRPRLDLSHGSWAGESWIEIASRFSRYTEILA